MKTRAWKMEAGGWLARSVLECGGAPPLSESSHDCRSAKSTGGPAQSKTWRFNLALLTFCFILLHSSFCLQASGQQYSIDWYKIAGGGGTSTGGVYSVSGTIGQHDAGGPMTGGSYSLTGGFWALISVVQTAGLPNLAITFVGPNSVKVSWPDTGTYTLQQNSNLAGGSWITSGYTITTSNGTNSITITPPTGNLFFRLKQP
jgi:hypothetical protein